MKMTAYYNEIDPYAAQWLRNLIAAGHIAAGEVDERSIEDLKADDLRGFDQCHFFAGIGGWSIALKLAGWPDDRPVWTGSCPCQPFSAAGQGKAADDERHLWPAWLSLIAECRPATIFGEQVEAAIGWGWLDVVFADLEAQSYAVGAAVLPACSIGAPHIRNRVWFVGHAARGDIRRDCRERARAQTESLGEGAKARIIGDDIGTSGATCGLADDDQGGREVLAAPRLHDNGQPWNNPDRCGESGGLADAAGEGRQGLKNGHGIISTQRKAAERTSGHAGFWADAEFIACTDGKARPVGPGLHPLAHGVRARPSKLRAYGNAIVPQAAAAFIRACIA
jgi:DNA (cytosine-5)-methyltransferase 1